MTNDIKEKLNGMADEKYRIFTSRLLPGVGNILGVRLPFIREIAEEIARGDWRGFMTEAGLSRDCLSDVNTVEERAAGESFEEIMLQGMVIGSAKADIDELLNYVAAFVPKLDNWSVCDSFCMSLKRVTKHKERVYNFIQPYFMSVKEFELRFSIVMLLNYYIDDKHIDDVLLILNSIKHEGYYVKMAVAWAVSVCFIKQAEKTMQFLQHNLLDKFTYNKALSKITESYRVDAKMKAVIRSMKRK